MIHILSLAALAFAIGMDSAPLKFVTVARGANSQIEASRTVVIRTAAEWSALWKEHAGESTPPAVDFARWMVIGVFTGTRPTGGYAVEITSVETRDSGAVVTYREQRPAEDAVVTQVLTSPFHLVRTERQSGRVTFQRSR